MAWGGDAVADGVEGFWHGVAMELRSMTATGVRSGVSVLYFAFVLDRAGAGCDRCGGGSRTVVADGGGDFWQYVAVALTTATAIERRTAVLVPFLTLSYEMVGAREGGGG